MQDPDLVCTQADCMNSCKEEAYAATQVRTGRGLHACAHQNTHARFILWNSEQHTGILPRSCSNKSRAGPEGPVTTAQQARQQERHLRQKGHQSLSKTSLAVLAHPPNSIL